MAYDKTNGTVPDFRNDGLECLVSSLAYGLMDMELGDLIGERDSLLTARGSTLCPVIHGPDDPLSSGFTPGKLVLGLYFSAFVKYL